MNKKERRHMDAIYKRAWHLTERIDAADKAGRKLSYDKAELAALNWALDILEEIEEDEERKTA